MTSSWPAVAFPVTEKDLLPKIFCSEGHETTGVQDEETVWAGPGAENDAFTRFSHQRLIERRAGQVETAGKLAQGADGFPFFRDGNEFVESRHRCTKW